MFDLKTIGKASIAPAKKFEHKTQCETGANGRADFLYIFAKAHSGMAVSYPSLGRLCSIKSVGVGLLRISTALVESIWSRSYAGIEK
jgi:hypothetical protein